MFSVRKTATIIILVLAACSPEGPDTPTVPGRWYTEAQIDTGQPLYRDCCAACHGADGGATADWRSPGPDGHYPPPPLNGSTHTWHHPVELLDFTIANGGGEFGGVMPGFGAALDQVQRIAMVANIQNWWPDEIYAKWKDIEQRSRSYDPLKIRLRESNSVPKIEWHAKCQVCIRRIIRCSDTHRQVKWRPAWKF